MAVRSALQQPIAVSAIDLGEEEEALVLEVLRSGQLAQGPMVQRLEAGFCDVATTRHAVAVSSGTTALAVALEALGIGAGDEVITSPFTFIATVNAILETGATATFVDIGDDFTIPTAGVEAAIGPATRAVMPVHLYGLPADVGAMARVTTPQGVALVEDAAQALGATDRGRAVGSFGVGCFSLYATKNLTSGEGGVVTCDDDELADRLRLLRNQGMRARYEYEIPGHNYRLTDLQAAVAIPQLSRLGVITEQRRKNADALTAGLSDVVGVSCPTVPEGRTHVWHQYTVRITQEAGVDRDEVARALADRGVGTGIYYPRIVTDHACYRDHPQVRESDVPNARAAASEVLSLPVHPGLSDEDLVTIVDAVRGVLGV